jgi:hypothetical protein
MDDLLRPSGGKHGEKAPPWEDAKVIGWLRRRCRKPQAAKADGPIGWAIMGTPPDGYPYPRTGYLRCSECYDLMKRDPNCSDLAVLTLHWMSEHPEHWRAMHPQDAA